MQASIPPVENRLFSALAVLFILTGCLATPLTPRSPIDDISVLKRLGGRDLGVAILDNRIHETAGHQYLFVAIPFGRVYLDQPEVDLWPWVETKLRIAGYRVSQARNPPSIQIELNKIQVSAYDFIIIRKIVVKVEGQIVIQKSPIHPAKQLPVVAEYTRWRALAFQGELEHAVERAFSSFADQVVELLS